jgi:hypothetical protein
VLIDPGCARNRVALAQDADRNALNQAICRNFKSALEGRIRFI